ncbi:MAG: hypothetical protein QXK12_01955 [Candidatus Nezhaarchaeales archaeon]
MFIFKKQQKIVEVGGVKIGGQPGENPVVLAGGVFFRGQPIVEDPVKGSFKEDLLNQWLNELNRAMDLTGLPGLIEVYAETPQAMVKHISWIADHWNGPLAFESPSPEARMAGVRYVAEAGLQGRAVFNSINPATSSEELRLIEESRIKAAIALSWQPEAVTLRDRLNVVKVQVARCEKANVKDVIVDPASLPVGMGYGSEWRVSLTVKALVGLPVCVGAYNAPSSWKLYKDLKSKEVARASIVAAAVTAAILSGVDLVFYGSLARCREVYAAAALIEHGVVEAVSEALREAGIDRKLYTLKV